MSVAAITDVVSISTVATIAATLGAIGPAAQLVLVLRSKSTKGLSRTTFTILTITFMLSLLLSIQYKLGPALILASISLAIKWLVLARISWVNALVLAVVGGLAALIVVLGPEAIATAVLSTRYSELVAFAWGLLFAITFVPQVFVSRRTRNTRNISLLMLVLSGTGIGLWLLFAVLVSNYSMFFWLSVVLISLLELTRLKLLEVPAAKLAESPGSSNA